ncbi:MAG TPA: nicotinate-nucleotide adenylyltransferase [Candidatus Dormibacteraeota bacterium]|nr:nicotinate-nucleotide adenylyltransferase [Candidatus Dormibacteraeota bacterium]
MRVGVLGGTFDPIHLGHLAAAEAAIACAELERVLIMPSAQPPHRPGAIATAEERLAMCRLAVEGRSRLEVSDVEVRHGGPSYTVDTVVELKRLAPQDDLFLILGWDAAALFSTWQRPEKVRSLAAVVVIGRPGTQAPGADQLSAAGLDVERTILCLRPTPDISGSALRRAIAAGETVSGKVPPAVERYIASHGLYRDNRKS